MLHLCVSNQIAVRLPDDDSSCLIGAEPNVDGTLPASAKET